MPSSSNLQYLKSTLGLGFQMAKSNFFLKNEGTWLGVFYYLLAPIITFIAMSTIFAQNLGNDIPNYPLYLIIGILLFNFFRTASANATTIIKRSAGVLKSLSFPREALIVSEIITLLLSHIFEIVILFGFLLYFDISLIGMIYYPLIILVLTLFTIGVSLLFATIGIYFFDFDNIWGFLLPLLWIATPIFHAIEGDGVLQLANMVNPLYYLITFARELIIYNQIPSLSILIGTFSFTVGLFITGIVVFKLFQNKFAEMV